MFSFINQRRRHLSGMLICLTFLFVMAQLSLFIIHYKVSELIDSLVNSSISQVLFSPVVVWPIVGFIVIQLLAYALLISWIRFMAVSMGELKQLSEDTVYWLGIILWLVACAAILTLNNYYFPDSFFAKALYAFSWLTEKTNQFILVVTVCTLLIGTSFAFINFFMHRRYHFTGIVILVLGFVLSIAALYNPSLSFFTVSETTKTPNVILIGLDSLRPDFTHYFGNSSVHTPHIDQFLQAAVVFPDNYTPLARTFPSWVSVLTAQHPLHNHVRNNLAYAELSLKSDTLAKRFQQAGYETIYATDEKRFSNITKGYGFHRVIGPAMGVDDFILGGLSDFPLSNLLVNLPIGRFLFPYNYANRAAAITYKPDNFLSLVNAGLAHRGTKPLFLAIHFCLSHWPYTWAQDHQPNYFSQPQRYASSIEAVDQQLGQLLQMLKQNGLLKNSVVVLLSDHGTTVGLPGDRFISQQTYVGDPKKLKWIDVSRPSVATKTGNDYRIDTSYGQGSDVLSLKQYRTLLAFKGFGITLPSKQVNERSSLMDVAPTLLDLFHLSPLPNTDGVSLKYYFSNRSEHSSPNRPFFIETGDKVAETETDKIQVEKVIKKRIGIYQVDLSSGLLFLNASAEKSLIENKQRAVIFDQWMLARYPAQVRMHLVPADAQSHRSILKPYTIAPYFVLINLKTGQWTIGLHSSLAKTAPVKKLMQQLYTFYGNEVPGFAAEMANAFT